MIASPIWIRSPSRSGLACVSGSPFKTVPLRLFKSSTAWRPSLSRTTRQCCREDCASLIWIGLFAVRPIVICACSNSKDVSSPFSSRINMSLGTSRDSARGAPATTRNRRARLQQAA